MEESIKNLVDELVDTRIEAEELIENIESAIEDIEEVKPGEEE